MAIKYHDFDLMIERSGDAFMARVIDSPAGEATVKFKLPYSQSDIENFFIQIGHTRMVESTQMQKMRGFGQELFEVIFSGGVRDKFRESLAEVSRKQDGLRIRLRIADVSELANMPWEFLYDTGLSRFLTLSIETPLVRYLDVPREIQPLTVHPPLHILAVICSPRNYPTLNVQKEWENLHEALSNLENRKLVRLTRLERPTLQALQRQLRRGMYHVFHFIGHGIFSKQYQDGQLLFEDEIGGGDPVSSRDLGILLHDHKHLRLAVLNACEGARTSMEDQFSGTAQSLMLQGLPAVIAQQFRITDIAAITMAREFYSALADGYPVDAALTEARKAIKMHGNELEWGTPVLYMRSPNGQIFDVESIQAAPARKQPKPVQDVDIKKLANLYTEGLEAFYLKEWEKAAVKFQAIVDIQSTYMDAASKLEFAQQQLKLVELDQKAQSAEIHGDWNLAIQTLETLAKEYPYQADITSRLENARKNKSLDRLYTEAQQLSEGKKWLAVLQVFDQIHRLDSEYPDKDNLLPSAIEASEVQKLKAELDSLYQKALGAIDTNNWTSAQEILLEIQSKEVNFRQTDKLLQRVLSEIELTKKQKQEKEQVASLYVQAENLVSRKQWAKAIEKIEEILNIQPNFDDPNRIANKARSELVKLQEETEKQEHLAKLYAEAVAFNQAEKYQQALDQWDQIRALDTTYPDRQRVRATAQRMLKKSSEPERITWKITWIRNLTPGWWILIVGLLWYAIRLGTITFTSFFEITNNATIEFVRWSIFGIATSLLNLLAFHFFKLIISKKQKIIHIGGWFAGSLATPLMLWLFPEFSYRFDIGYSLTGFLYGLALHYTLPDFRYRPNLSTLLITFTFGFFVGDCSYTWFINSAGIGAPHNSALTIGIAGLTSTSLAFSKTIFKNSDIKYQETIEKFVLSVSGLLIASRWLGSVIGDHIVSIFLNPAGISWDKAPYLLLNMWYGLFAVFAAWFFIWLLKNKLAIHLTKKEMTFLAFFWILGMVATSFLSIYLGIDLDIEWSWRIGWSVGGTLIGLGMWFATKEYTLRNKSIYLLISLLGWGFGFFISEQIVGVLQALFTPIFGYTLSENIAVNINVGFAGLIGGLILILNLTNEKFLIVKHKELEKANIRTLPNLIATIWQWLTIFIVFVFSRLIIEIVIHTTGLFGILDGALSSIGATIIYFVFLGFSTGSALWLSLRETFITSDWKTWLTLSLTSSISLTVFFTGAALAEIGSWSWTIAWVFIGICIGLVLAYFIKKRIPTLSKRLFWQMPFIWAVSFVIGQQFAGEINTLIFGTKGPIKDLITRVLETGIYGLIGCLLTIKLLEFEHYKKTKQLTVTLSIVVVILIFFAYSTGLQAFQRSFINEPFAQAIGIWGNANQTLRITRNILTGTYTIKINTPFSSSCLGPTTGLSSYRTITGTFQNNIKYTCDKNLSNVWFQHKFFSYEAGSDIIISTDGTTWIRK